MKNRIILGGSPVILDIGTYDGTDSIEFLDLYNNARIFAFEADLRSIDLFKHSISSKESLQILINYYNLNPQTTIDKLFELVNSSKLTLVEKAISDIDFVWADLNGGEKELIEGGINTYKNHVNYLYTEFSDNKMMEGQPTLNEILDMLEGTFTVLDKKINGTGMYGNVLLKNKNI